MTGSANPFVGPRPFEPGEHLWGRDREIRELDNLLAAERVVLLCSPSGAGKSSLMQAGLLPRLKQTFDVWGPTRLNQEPPAGVRANRYALSAILGLEEGVPERLRRPPQVLAGQTLRDYAKNRPRRRSAPRSILLVFDQFEEVLTVDPLATEAKEEFFDQLGELLRDPGVWALFALREDYLAPLDPYAERVPTHLANRFRIDLLGLDGAREAMVNPAREAGREFPAAGQLVRDLALRKVQQPDSTFVEQVGQHVEPVQLQVVCRRLWDAMPPEDRSITAEDLAQFGDVNAALSDYYAEAVARLAAGSLATERALRDWFGESLIAGGIRSQVLRRSQVSGGLANELIEQLLDTHLVRAEKRAGATWYELAHDRLIGSVQCDNLGWREKHLSAAQRRADVWERQGRPPGLLLAGEDLAAAERWAAGAPAVTEVERLFLAASREAQAIAERERRQARRIKRLAVVAMVIGVLALLTAAFAVVQMVEANKQRRVAVAQSQEADRQRREAVRQREQTESERRRAEQEKRAADTARVEAVQQRGAAEEQKQIAEEQGRRATAEELNARAKALEANAARLEAEGRRTEALQEKQRADKLRTEAETSEQEAERLSRLSAARALALQTLRPQQDDQRELSALLALAAWRLHRANHGEAGDPDLFNALRTALGRLRPDAVLRGAEDAVRSLAPDGDTVIAGSDDGGVRRFDLSHPTAPPQNLGRYPSGVRALALSADGRFLAAGLVDGTLRVSDRRTGEPPRELPVADRIAGALAMQPGTHRLAAGGRDGTLKLLDLDRPAEPAVPLATGGRRVTSLAFSPDGGTLAAGLASGGALLWNPAQPTSGRPACAGKDVRSLAFSPDGQTLACGAGQGEIVLWRTTGAANATASLTGHTSSVNSLSFSPQGDLLASASSDGTLRLWDLHRPGVSPVVLRGHEAWVWAVAFTPDGARLSSGGADAAVRLWEVRPDLLATEICQHVHRGLTREEWTLHMPAGLPFPEEALCPPGR